MLLDVSRLEGDYALGRGSSRPLSHCLYILMVKFGEKSSSSIKLEAFEEKITLCSNYVYLTQFNSYQSRHVQELNPVHIHTLLGHTSWGTSMRLLLPQIDVHLRIYIIWCNVHTKTPLLAPYILVEFFLGLIINSRGKNCNRACAAISWACYSL